MGIFSNFSSGGGSISNDPSAWLTIMLVLNIYKYIWPFSHSKGIIFFATFIEKFWLQSFLLEIWCCIAGNFLDPGKKGTTLSNFCWTSVTVRQSSDQPGVENGEMDHWRKTNSGGKSCLNNVWLRISALLYFVKPRRAHGVFASTDEGFVWNSPELPSPCVSLCSLCVHCASLSKPKSLSQCRAFHGHGQACGWSGTCLHIWINQDSQWQIKPQTNMIHIQGVPKNVLLE